MLTERFYVSSLALLLLVQSWMVSRAVLLSNFTDQSSLLAFKSAIKIDPNSLMANNWTEKTNFCNWVGVMCSHRRQRVTRLRLGDMGLTGTISPHVGNLSFLLVLDLRNNSFHGKLIHELSYLHRLRTLIIQFNSLEGEIPASLHHCQKLQSVSIAYNELIGRIPKELSTLPWLRYLFLGGNNLTGTIPPFFGNMSSLEWLGLEINKFHGNIPNEMARIPNLKGINFGGNHLNGSIPPSLFNVSSFEKIALWRNDLSGDLPFDAGLWLPNLNALTLTGNQLTGNIPSYLSNSSMLTTIDLGSNKFTGILPTNLSTSLQIFIASNCQIKGRIPETIGSLRNLNYLILSGNSLSGTIPRKIKGMERLQLLYLDGNDLEGPIPAEICLLSNLGDLILQNNKISGSIPDCIGNLSHLQKLFLDSNALSSTIPLSLWRLDNLLFLNLSFNALSGGLGPSIRAIKTLESIDLSWNQMPGNIPSAMEAFQSLSSLNLSHNSFWGPIPESLGRLVTLDYMDLSNNRLSGPIPKSLEALSRLTYLNLSHNKLSGEIPRGGPFANFSAESFLENGQLCGLPILKLCTSHGTRKSRNKLFSYIIPAIAAVAIFGALLYMLRKCRGNNVQSLILGNSLHGLERKMFSFQELSRATNNFCEANLLGVGSFGSVYKGILSDGEIVAVKLLNLQLDGAIESFDAECKVLRTVRHRNLVKVISACTNPELRALVLQYMSNGSLEKWLYSHNYCLDLLQRVSIMLDVALALEYLHHGQSEPVIHCDLKPSNILLDGDMVAHVADFGIAKILAANKIATQTNTLGTFGYIAPEYGAEGRVSTKGDTYSYGITLLETFTRKKPTDEMFAGELSLRQWVSVSLPNKIMEVVDGGLFTTVQGACTTAMQRNLLAILGIGLGCSKDLPEERSDIKDVVAKLNKIKLQILCDGGA